MQLINLKTNFLGRNFKFYNVIDSTQSEIWRLIDKDNIENGFLVMADIQTKGKGTHGRVWHTDEKNNIAFSFYLETNCSVSKLDGITVDIANIILNIFKSKYGISLSIKEPNDIVYCGKKIGGILTESRVVSDFVKFLVVGIGINTNKIFFTDDIKDLATSIKKEFDIDIDSLDFITEFCNIFEDKIIKDIYNNTTK